MEGEWSCYRGGQFKGGRMVKLHFNGRENGHVKEVVFNGGSMVMLLRWSVQWRENGHVTEVDSNRESMIVREVVKLMEVEWSCYGGGQ